MSPGNLHSPPKSMMKSKIRQGGCAVSPTHSRHSMSSWLSGPLAPLRLLKQPSSVGTNKSETMLRICRPTCIRRLCAAHYKLVAARRFNIQSTPKTSSRSLVVFHSSRNASSLLTLHGSSERLHTSYVHTHAMPLRRHRSPRLRSNRRRIQPSSRTQRGSNKPSFCSSRESIFR